MILRRLLLLLLSILSLVVGATIYLLFRPENLIIFKWIDSLQLIDTVEVFRDKAKPLYDTLPEWFIYSLPNGIWLFSFITAISVIWFNERKFLNYYSLSILAFAILIEIGQYFGFVIGTFDIYDLLIILLFGGAGLIVTNCLINDEN